MLYPTYTYSLSAIAILTLCIIIGFSSCGLKKITPKTSVLSSKKEMLLSTLPNHEINYTSKNYVDFPIIPFQIFGLTYDEDLILVTKHPDWNMHEIAAFNTPEGKKWMIKDSKEPSLDQIIHIDYPQIENLLPEIPLSIIQTPLSINDNSTEELLDIDFKYVNSKNESVNISYLGKRELKPIKKRNGSTMGHSKNQLLAVLDLPARRFAKDASVHYDQKEYKIQKILGLVKFQMLLTQTQGGISSGSLSFSLKNGDLISEHSQNIKQKWTIVENEHEIILRQKNELRTANYYFSKNDDALCLTKADVSAFDADTTNFSIRFYPPLPDFRKEFKEEHTSQFVLSVNGQPGHGYGNITSKSKGTNTIVSITPEEPWWINERPMVSTIAYRDSSIKINTTMAF